MNVQEAGRIKQNSGCAAAFLVGTVWRLAAKTGFCSVLQLSVLCPLGRLAAFAVFILLVTNHKYPIFLKLPCDINLKYFLHIAIKEELH